MQQVLRSKSLSCRRKQVGDLDISPRIVQATTIGGGEWSATSAEERVPRLLLVHICVKLRLFAELAELSYDPISSN